MSHLRLLIAQMGKTPLVSIIMLLLAVTPASGVGARFMEIKIDADKYRIELARTSAERRQGLMHRQRLDRYGGMLLMYPRSGDHRIWMKNMSIALRVYWIDSDFTVIDSKRLEPCRQDPCPVYSVTKPSMYVLELSDHDHGLKPGDRINAIIDP